MHTETELIGTIAMGLSAAFVIGLVADRLRIPSIVGYLIAGMIVGPFTPGYVANATLAPQLAELGVIFLMFGVGLHFSLSDLLQVRNIAILGAIVQLVIAVVLSLVVAKIWGWSFGAGLVFGLGLSVASTVVLLRALLEMGDIGKLGAMIAVGWCIIQDLITVVALVLMPVLADSLGGTSPHTAANGILQTIVTSLGKLILFLVVMLVVGRRVLPWVFKHVAGVDSRELFILAVLASALGVAYGSSEIFSVSFALGAFVAGLALSETEFGRQAEEEIYPIREIFAILFFVSVGMLIDPKFLLDHPDRIAIVTLIVVVAKGLGAFGIIVLLNLPVRTGVTVAVGLAQIGEFSFILATMGMQLDILPRMASDLILAGALVSISINPLLFKFLPAMVRWSSARLPDRSGPTPLPDPT